MKKYRNPWIPAEALKRLAAETGTILDVGGGAAPYAGATHILDVQPYDAERLRRNAWGGASRLVLSPVSLVENKRKDSCGEGSKETADGRPQTLDLGLKTESEEFLTIEDTEARSFLTGGRTREGREGVGDSVSSFGFRVSKSTHQPINSSTAPGTTDQGLLTKDYGPRTMDFLENQYTQLDICNGERWPFDDNQFDLGLSSHCLEDIPKPLAAVRELARVCRRTLIVTPSRLLEQTRGIDHPDYCGFKHHHWMVFEEHGRLVFQRKTDRLMESGCHLHCPIGKTLPIELGSVAFEGEGFDPLEKTFATAAEEMADLRTFVAQWIDRKGVFVRDPRARSWRYWVYRMKLGMRRRRGRRDEG